MNDRQNRPSESRQNRKQETTASQSVSWSGQQDLNLRQPVDFTQGDSDKHAYTPAADRARAGCDSDRRSTSEAKRVHREISRWLARGSFTPEVATAAERVKCALYMRAKNPRSESLTRHLAEVTDELEAALASTTS